MRETLGRGTGPGAGRTGPGQADLGGGGGGREWSAHAHARSWFFGGRVGEGGREGEGGRGTEGRSERYPVTFKAPLAHADAMCVRAHAHLSEPLELGRLLLRLPGLRSQIRVSPSESAHPSQPIRVSQ